MITLMALACADINAVNTGLNAEDKNFGVSENVSYRCETSTFSSDGKKWSYQSDEVMNLMGDIKLRVSRDSDDFGVVVLPKIDRDTFGDGNLTLRLKQLGARKSIEVTHGSVQLFAPAENGSCTAEERLFTQDHQEGGFDQFILKVPERCEGACQFSLQTNLPVATVVYRAEEWELAESQDPINDFSVSYSFNQAGSRLISVTGYDIAGRELASDSRQVQVNVQREPVIPRDSRLSVPYFYQYQNQLHPSASCQNTSIAMVLKFLGASVTPDQITGRFGKDRAQSVDGLNSVFNQLARELGVRQLRSTGSGSLAELRAALDAGSPVIIHGYFTSYGHVLVVTGYDERGYYVNDPAGRWSGYFKGGYPSAWGEPAAGHDTFYTKAAFEAAVATSDGSTQLPLWMHWLER